MIPQKSLALSPFIRLSFISHSHLIYERALLLEDCRVLAIRLFPCMELRERATQLAQERFLPFNTGAWLAEDFLLAWMLFSRQVFVQVAR
jgi:hypothetical protein